MDSCLNWPSICNAALLSRSPKWTGITGAIPIERKGVSVVFTCILSIFIFEWIEILETFNCPECFHTKHSSYKSSGDWTFPPELTNLKSQNSQISWRQILHYFRLFADASMRKFQFSHIFHWVQLKLISVWNYESARVIAKLFMTSELFSWE